MKYRQMVRSLPFRIAAFALCLLFAALTIACVFAVSALIELEAYSHSKENFRESMLGTLYSDTGYQLARRADAGDWDGVRYYDQSNLRYALYRDGAVAATNCDDPESMTWSYQNEYLFSNYSSDVLFAETASAVAMDPWYEPAPVDEDEQVEAWGEYRFCATLADAFAGHDRFSLVSGLAEVLYALRYSIYALLFVCVAAMVALLVMLMQGAGYRRGEEDVHLSLLSRVPFDLFLCAAVVLAGFSLLLADRMVGVGSWNERLLLGVWLVWCAALALVCGMSAAARVKAKTWYRNTVIFRVLSPLLRALRWLWRRLKEAACGLPLVWRTAAGFAALCALELIGLVATWWEPDNLIVLWVLEKLVLLPTVVLLSLMLRKLQKGGEALAAGDLGHQIDTSKLLWDMKRHGENLNSIAVGMNRAVDERMKSERFKTELITNVSHDIKTPLTSIVNYTELITREQTDNEKIDEYCAVLTRQSERLKKLIEDLVEASKASTGNIEAHLAPCQIGVLLTQAAGEYEKRLADADLTLVTQLTEEEVRIQADGRLLWRVLDNVMNNACKYAQPGTRVYLTLEREGGEAVIALKNISAQPLNISADELLERFVRGDSARTGEGSGLGLSIAQSLTELQGGTLSLTVDGDLFKVVLRFLCIE